MLRLLVPLRGKGKESYIFRRLVLPGVECPFLCSAVCSALFIQGNTTFDYCSEDYGYKDEVAQGLSLVSIQCNVERHS